jgi:hypothetical protein
MCIGGNLWTGMGMLYAFAIPFALLIMNILFSRFTKWYKKSEYKHPVIAVSIFISLFWIYSYFYAKCM